MSIRNKCQSLITSNGSWKIIAVLMAIAGFFARDAYSRLWETQAELAATHEVTRELVNSHDRDIGIIRNEMVHWTKAVNDNTDVLRELGETIVDLRLELERRRP